MPAMYYKCCTCGKFYYNIGKAEICELSHKDRIKTNKNLLDVDFKPFKRGVAIGKNV